MRCDDVRMALSHGEYDMLTRRRIEEHIASCLLCREFREYVRRLDEQLTSLSGAEPPAALAERIRNTLAQESATPDTTRHRKETQRMPYVLAVDDEPNIVRLMQVNLEKHGYRVETASNGAQALAKIRTHCPDLLVSDVMMPEMDGFELLANIRRDPSLADLPVIMLTAKAQDRDVMEGYRTGADMYLTKPFNPAELIAFAKRILSSSQDYGENRYEL